MYDDSILNEMQLPQVNPNEELETISSNFFRHLFDITNFEIRSQEFRDKGIDFQIEIKKLQKFTGFRFAVQLKATASKPINSDGSISVQIYTSNINYLLNFSMPSFYVLYFSSDNTFLYENINDFIKILSDKDKNWQNQESHVLRFTKSLVPEGITEMYNMTLKRGLFHRQINEKLALLSNQLNKGDKITLDTSLKVTDDSEIRRMIESIGFELINEARWSEIITLHKRASGNVASSAKYNLVLGIAFYYNSHLIESLSFLNAASKQISELPDDLKKHLAFFENTVKYSIGILSQNQYSNKLQELEEDENIGLYIKLEKAKKKYIESLNQTAKIGYEKFITDVQKLINDPNAEKSFILFAKCELIFHEGSKNNMDYVREISLLNAYEEEFGPTYQARLEFARGFIQLNRSWTENVQLLKNEALESKNYLVFFNAIINEVRAIYEFYAYASIIKIEQELPGYPSQEIPNTEQLFDELFVKINKAYEYYTKIGHIENILVTLSLKYEMLHFSNYLDKADSTLNEIDNLLNTYDLENQRSKLLFLKEEGPTHARLKMWVDEVRGKVKSDKLEYDNMISEMKQMDSIEKTKKNKNEPLFVIQLFPIGFFQFPKTDREKIYKILNIRSKKISRLYSNMFDNGIVPIANIFYNKISQEGYMDGKLADRGIENWRNIFKVRKAFYENNYSRFEIGHRHN
jgi:hypothetical protein